MKVQKLAIATFLFIYPYGCILYTAEVTTSRVFLYYWKIGSRKIRSFWHFFPPVPLKRRVLYLPICTQMHWHGTGVAYCIVVNILSFCHFCSFNILMPGWWLQNDRCIYKASLIIGNVFMTKLQGYCQSFFAPIYICYDPSVKLSISWNGQQNWPFHEVDDSPVHFVKWSSWLSISWNGQEIHWPFHEMDS